MLDLKFNHLYLLRDDSRRWLLDHAMIIPTPWHCKWIKQISWTLNPLNPWKNRTLVKQKPISIASSSSQLWQKQKTCVKVTKTAAASIPKQSSQPWRKGLLGSMARISPTYRWGNRPQQVLYRQVCFHNGRPRPTILVGSWSQRRNTCRSFLGMKPSKGCQWVAIYIYIFIGDVTITSYFLMLHFFWGTISREVWRRNPFHTENTETWLNFKISKKLHLPKKSKKDIPKKQTSLHNYIYTIPRHLWIF